MRTRSTTAIATIALVGLVSACGPSEQGGSGLGTRTKNAALAAACATGGECKIGDIGPGGGVVFYDAGSVQTWGRFLEASRTNAAADQLWCSTYRDIPGADATSIGTGAQNTRDMDAACNSGAGQVAADWVSGGRDDWFLPSRDELIEMFKQKKILALDGEFLFSSSEAGYWTAWDIYMGDGTPYPQGKNNGRIVRPIRAFTPVVATTTSSSTTTTLAPTTTGATATGFGSFVAGAACADGGACKIGDRGPGGGTIVFDAGANTAWGRYLEAAPNRENRVRVWCNVRKDIDIEDEAVGYGYFNTADWVNRCGTDTALRYAWDYATPSRDDWFLPSYAEMVELANVAAKGFGFDLGGSDYWTSSVYDPGFAVTAGTNWRYPGTRSADNMQGGGRMSYPMRYVVAGETTTRKAPAPQRPAGPPTTTTSSTTTTTPKPATTIAGCAAGGPCKIGDVGPGGGTIFYDARSEQTWGRYLEVAPSILNSVKVWCNVRPNSTNNGKEIGDGYFNTGTRAGQCGPNTAIRYAWDYTTPTRDDWFVPSLGEMKALMIAGNGIMNTEYWTSTRYDDGGVYTVYNFGRGTEGIDNITAGGRLTAPIRYVRSGESANGKATPPTTTTTSTTTTLPKPTTTTLPCARGGACKVGDVGPAGGIVFYDAGTKQPWGRFLEAAPRDYTTKSSYDNVDRNTVVMWCNNYINIAGALGDGFGAGRANTTAIAKTCTNGAGRFGEDYVSGGATDWYLPSKAELNALFQRKDLFGELGMNRPGGFLLYSNSCYWSSTQENVSGTSFRAWMQQSVNLTQWNYVKNQSCFARFIRSF